MQWILVTVTLKKWCFFWRSVEKGHKKFPWPNSGFRCQSMGHQRHGLQCSWPSINLVLCLHHLFQLVESPSERTEAIGSQIAYKQLAFLVAGQNKSNYIHTVHEWANWEGIEHCYAEYHVRVKFGTPCTKSTTMAHSICHHYQKIKAFSHFYSTSY